MFFNSWIIFIKNYYKDETMKNNTCAIWEFDKEESYAYACKEGC